MPIKFRCIACGQLLGIARRKAGTVVSCPSCRHPLTVPLEDQAERPVASAAPLLEARDFDKWISHPEPAGARVAGAVIPSRTVDVADAEAEVVAEPQWLGPISELSHSGPSTRSGPRSTTVSIRLLVVFAVAIAAVAFTGGILVGRFLLPAPAAAGGVEPAGKPAKAGKANRAEPAVEPKEPSAATGLVQYKIEGTTQPDAGARVLILPSDPPAQRIVVRGLCAGDDSSPERPGYQRLLASGGRFAVVDAAGKFHFQLPAAGLYRVLIISAAVGRDEGREIYAADLATLRRYFSDPDLLLGDRDFLLITRQFHAGQAESIPYTFIDSVRGS